MQKFHKMFVGFKFKSNQKVEQKFKVDRVQIDSFRSGGKTYTGFHLRLKITQPNMGEIEQNWPRRWSSLNETILLITLHVFCFRRHRNPNLQA